MNETDYCQSCWSRELDSGGRCMRCGWTPCLVETGPIKTTYIGHEMVRRIEEYYEKARVKAEHERDAARKKAERELDDLRRQIAELSHPNRKLLLRERDHARKEAERYRDQLYLAYQVPPVPLPWEKDKP